MNPLNQPPPDVSAPPPSKAAILSRRKWWWLKIAGILSILGCALVVAAPLVIRRSCHSGHTESLHNVRSMGLALFEFETEYGSFPDATTIALVREQTGSSIPMGTSTSNDFFRQLFASGIASSESMFYARSPGARKGDNFFEGSRALEKGECGFTYFLGAKSTDRPDRPLVVAPMIPGTDRFDPKPMEGRAVVLKRDNSVMSILIDKHGHLIFEGRNLMDPHHPVWEGHAPSIAWPE
ncbi:MAG: hypothetical protein EOP88_10525 [Verrucomicrobiaceae bacterium]|nr:MAG: hypothetical protein EOP88_10525 [Verrucomicrobiaceae bacterium]